MVSVCPSVVLIVSRGNESPGFSSGIAILLHGLPGAEPDGTARQVGVATTEGLTGEFSGGAPW
jgi:hypothetical protein